MSIPNENGTVAHSDEPLLSVRGLNVEHWTSAGYRPVLQEVSFDLFAGQIVSVIGESGSGKSTLASTILGVLPPTSKVTGTISFQGQNLVGSNEQGFQQLRGRSLALVPQDTGTSLNPLLTIGRQITEVFAIHRIGRSSAERRAKAIELLESVGVDRPAQRLKQYPHQLSGGLKQRVLIAIGFALRPQLLIADEPTSALDVTVQQKVLAVFEELARETGTSVLFITHDIGVATDHSSRSLVIREGRIVENKPIEQIITSPESDYTRLLLDVSDIAGAQSPTAAAAAVDDTPAVVAHDLVKTYGRGAKAITAVKQVSLKVQAGTTFALVGESGSGKTTTARALLGLVHPDSGDIDVDGVRVSVRQQAKLKELWRHIQYVHQNPWLSLDPRLPVLRSLQEPLRGLSVPRENWRVQIDEVLTQVALAEEVLTRRPSELSGGQRQRVVLARALLSGARVLVLDEVLSALDVVTQQQILDLLADLQDRLGLTYIFISHDLSIVRAISHEIAVLRGGEVVESGTTHDVFSRPQHPYTQELLAAIPGRRIAELRGEAIER